MQGLREDAQSALVSGSSTESDRASPDPLGPVTPLLFPDANAAAHRDSGEGHVVPAHAQIQPDDGSNCDEACSDNGDGEGGSEAHVPSEPHPSRNDRGASDASASGSPTCRAAMRAQPPGAFADCQASAIAPASDGVACERTEHRVAGAVALQRIADATGTSTAAEDAQRWWVLRSIDAADLRDLISEGDELDFGERDAWRGQGGAASPLLPAPSRRIGRDVVAARTARDEQRADWEAALASAAGVQQDAHRHSASIQPEQQVAAGRSQHRCSQRLEGSRSAGQSRAAHQVSISGAPVRSRRRRLSLPTDQAAVRAGIRVLEAAAKTAKERKVSAHKQQSADASAGQWGTLMSAAHDSCQAAGRRTRTEPVLLRRGCEREVPVTAKQAAQQRLRTKEGDSACTASVSREPMTVGCVAGQRIVAASVAQAARHHAAVMQPEHALQV